MNGLLIRWLMQLYLFKDDDFTVECPTGSGQQMNPFEVSRDIAARLERTFLRGDNGRRPVCGGTHTFREDPHWYDLILPREHFDGDDDPDLGAGNQTGWIGLGAPFIQLLGQLSAADRLATGGLRATTGASDGSRASAGRTVR
jgi:hypothetical protein